MTTPLQMMGGPGSPYTCKMTAALRYRRIPYVFLLKDSPEALRQPQPRVPLMPTFYLPNESGEIVPETDSTPLIRRFEQEFEGRSAIPPHPAVAFLDELLEDYADEWLTKCMFHYRWHNDADATKARRILAHAITPNVTDEQIAPTQQTIGDRQIGRLWVVGSNEVTAPVIEECYERFLAAFDAHLQISRFLFGGRPASSDFAVWGQLTCMFSYDPTPSSLAAAKFPRVYGWTTVTDDLSGLEPEDSDWFDPSELPNTLRGLFDEVGRTHAPFLLANAEAVDQKAEKVQTEIGGRPWVQKPFPYQRKCLRWLRESYGQLDDQARAIVDATLDGTGCEVLFG